MDKFFFEKSKDKQCLFQIHRAHLCLETLEATLVEKNFDITYSQFRVLIAATVLESTNQRAIADFWRISPAAISRQIDLLEEKKLIRKTPHKKNKRKNIIDLTDEGESIVSQAMELLEEELAKIFAMDDSKQEGLIQRLNQVSNKTCDIIEAIEENSSEVKIDSS